MRRNMVNRPMMLESLYALGSSGAKAQNNKKSWNCTIFFKFRDRQRFKEMTRITRLI